MEASLPKNFFFNEDWPSDTEGDLQATVLFAQSHVMPSKPRIADEITCHLTSLRRTLVMLQPKSGVADSDEVTVTAEVEVEGAVTKLGAVAMKPPSEVPKQVTYTGIDPGSVTFPTSLDGSASVSSGHSRLGDPEAAFLAGLLRDQDVTISLFNGGWTRTIYLPPGAAFAGRTVLVTSSAGYSSSVEFTGANGGKRSVGIYRGTTTAFVNVGGTWVSPQDLLHNDYVFGRFWTAVLPAEYVVPGLRLTFTQGEFAKTGVLADIHVGGASELLLHTIDLGFLTPPRNAFAFANDPTAHAEYFENIPASRMVVGQYETVHLTEVAMPDGRVFTPDSPDPSEGGWHSGGMRQSIGKTLVSHGIDNANYGKWSSPGTSEGGHPYMCAQLTAHNSVGLYSNGRQVHGGSGGNGMVTLDSSLGNEFSHEVGHNFGLGHYPGGFVGSVQHNSGKAGSSWGWLSARNAFIPNFGAAKNNAERCCCGDNAQCEAPFLGFQFGNDAMAGGSPNYWSDNRFTLYTPYSMRNIQRYFEGKAVFAKDSPTGFRKWDPAAKRMADHENRVEQLDVASAHVGKTGDAAYMASLFAKADVVRVAMYNGGWSGTIAVPEAAAANQGKLLEVKHGAGWATTVVMNGGEQVRVAYGETKVFRSDGAKWSQVDGYQGYAVKVPSQFGVAVTTVVGFYDPDTTLKSYVYPALHGAYGFVYPDDSATLGEASTSCQLVVTTGAGVRRFKLANTRFGNGMNKFHANVAASEGATRAEVHCGGKVVASRDLEGPKANLTYTVNGVPL